MTAFSGNWFQRRSARRKSVSEAYRRLLAHALAPVHYAASGVPDTFEGRARMVTVLSSLACARLSQLEGTEPPRLIQRLDTLVLDGFDAAYREKGVGDASIARKVRKLAQGHAGLGKALFAALGDAESPGQAAREAGHPMVRTFDDKEAAARALGERLRPGDFVLVKASRALAFETVVEQLSC